MNTKTRIAFALAALCVAYTLLGFAVGRAFGATKHPSRKVEKTPAGPVVIAQRNGGAPDRTLLTIRNPLPRAVWVYIECPKALTEVPVGIPGRTTADVNIACPSDVGDGCLINHWTYQNGHSPETWRP